jgi:hypothetical protein
VAVTPVDMTDAIPLTEADGVTGRNNGRDIRVGWMASMLSPVPGDSALSVREGVFAHDYDGQSVTSLAVLSEDTIGTASRTVRLLPGSFVKVRAGQGPYIGFAESEEAAQLDPADSANPRYDVVYTMVSDKASIPADTAVGAPWGVVNGSPNATPTLPAIPANAIALARVRRPAGVDAISSSDITDLRQSTSLAGATRFLLPGDSLTAAGLVPGDKRARLTNNSLFPTILTDIWDGAKWRGTQEIVLPKPGQAGSGALAAAATMAVSSVAIPDPGWPYYIEASGAIEWQRTGTPPSTGVHCQMTYDSTTISTNIISAGYEVFVISAAGQMTRSGAGRSPVLTGAHTVYMLANNGGTVSTSILANTLYQFNAKLIPA